MARTALFLGSPTVCLLLVGIVASAQSETPPYKDPQRPVEQRVEDLLGRMTAAEKARMLAGSGWMESSPIERLGVPAIKMADGPMGVRNWAGSSAVTNAATTAPVQATAFPASGRNFEGYGEDPYLASRMAVAYVRGLQGEGVIPSVKHFAANNQEFERHRIDEEIDSRTLQEIYLPAFRAAVKEAGAWAVMNAYNKVNGQYCAESPMLLRETLRSDWGFKGLVVSDWGSTYSTAPTVNAGMDLEMPGGEPMRRWIGRPETQKAGNGAGWLTEDKVLAAIASGEVRQTTVDDSVRGILRVMFSARLFDAPHTGGGEVDTPEQRAVARRAARESMVLLTNDGGLLPLDARKTRSLAVIGPSAAVARTGGGGSSLVRPKYAVTAFDGIKEAAGANVQVGYALGVAMQGEEAPADPKATLAEAVALAGKSDVAVVVVGYSFRLESEGHDRPSLDLPAGQDDLIRAVASANRNTVVVVMAGAPVTMTGWIKDVRAVLYAWYGGQEAGHAVGDLLFGAATPAGKLPVTFPVHLEDSPAYGNYPGENLHVRYAEGIYVGYRGFDKRRVEPLFPFGFGLSYTTFEYGGLRIDKPTVKSGEPVNVSVQVRNRGTRAGAEAVQLYLRDVEASLDRPDKELKGFRRVELQPGETKTVDCTLDEAALSFFHPGKKLWLAEPGGFQVLIGASSRDIRLQGSFALAQ